MTDTVRLVGLPAVALALVGGVLAIQVRNGGGSFEPVRPADPCQERTVTSRDTGIDGLTERLVLLGTLPPASELVDEALDNADLNGFLEAAIRALPDSVIDAALQTDDVLIRAIDDLDLRAVLADLDDQAALDDQMEAAITQAVKDSLVARLEDLLP